jgi:acetyl esterase/lipase
MSTLTRRNFAKMAAGASLGLAWAGPAIGAARTVAGNATAREFDLLPHVHPELRPLVKPIMGMHLPIPSMQTLETFRKMAMQNPPMAQPAWSERVIPGPTGAPDVRVVIVNAKQGGEARPAILHTHGGGFFAGTTRSSLRLLQEIALALDCVIVSVDYRLAPEIRYDGSVEDNYAGLKWLYRNAAEIGGDPKRIAVLGESAGGGHAALLAIAARDRGEIPLAYQALIYPMLDDRTGSVVMPPPHIGAIMWTPASNRFGWTSFLGVEAGSRHVPTAGVPARTRSLKGLPPTFIAVGSIDLFVDEDIAYARRLVDSGVSTELHVIPGAFHGFDVVPTKTLGAKFKATLIDALRQGLIGR